MGWGSREYNNGSRSGRDSDRGDSQRDDRKSRRREEKKIQLQATFQNLIMHIGAEDSYKDGVTRDSLKPFLESIYFVAAGARNRAITLPIGVGHSGDAQRMLPEGFKVSTSGPGSVASDHADGQPPLDLRVTAEKITAAKYTVTGNPTLANQQYNHTLPTVHESGSFGGPFVHEPSPRRGDAYASTSRMSTPSTAIPGNYRFSTNASGRRNYDGGSNIPRGFDP